MQVLNINKELFFSISACGNLESTNSSTASVAVQTTNTTTNVTTTTQKLVTVYTTSQTGDLYHVTFNEVICFQSIHVVHAIMSYLVVLIFFAMIFLSVMLGYENRYTKDPGSK